MPELSFQPYTLIQLKRISRDFARELKSAETGQKNSLAFIRHPLPKQPLIKPGQTFQAMVIGGTNFRSVLVTKTGSGLSFSDITESNVPKFTNAEIFSQFFLDHLADQVSIIAINFAFPLNPQLNQSVLDGSLTTGRKGHAFTGVIDQLVGRLLAKYVKQKTSRDIQVSLANDTICLMLSGSTQARRIQLVGSIIGTGVNFALFTDDHTAINLESGSFDKLPQTSTGQIIDQTSVFPGQAKIEKEISGAFLYQHFNLLVDESDQIKSTDQLSHLAETNHKNSDLAKKLLNRSASLAAAQIAGIYHYKNIPQLTFVTEGSLFWKAYHYQSDLKQYLSQLDVPSSGINFVHVKDCDLLGAAHLVA